MAATTKNINSTVLTYPESDKVDIRVDRPEAASDWYALATASSTDLSDVRKALDRDD